MHCWNLNGSHGNRECEFWGSVSLIDNYMCELSTDTKQHTLHPKPLFLLPLVVSVGF